MSNKWHAVGEYLKQNAGQGVALVGSLLTGNVPGAVAAGVALVSSATGVNDPTEVLAQLQGNPETMVELKRLAYAEQASIREHIRLLAEQEFLDKQAEHHETQETIRAGDKAEDRFIRWTRPGQSWLSLSMAFTFIWGHGISNEFDIYVLGMLLALPWAYAGLRQIGKGIQSFTSKGAGA